MINDTLSMSRGDSVLIRSSQHLEYYKELSEKTLDLCDQSFVDTKRAIIQEFDTLIQYLNDRKIELLTQLAVELECHKQELEKNRDKAQHLIESIDRKLRSPIQCSQPRPQTAPSSGITSPSINSTTANSGTNSSNNGVTSPTISLTPPGSSTSTSLGNSQSLSKSSSIGSSTGLTASALLTKSTSSIDLLLDSDGFLKMDQLAVLKESIDIIDWKWVPEFQQMTTKTRIIASPRPLSPRQAASIQSDGDDYSTESTEDYLSNISSSTSNMKINISTNSYGHHESSSSSSSSSIGGGNLQKSASVESLKRAIMCKDVNIFGKLEYGTRQHPEYKELSAILPRQSFIYSIGGHLNGFDQYSLERYDIHEGRWRALKPLHQMDNDFTSHYDGRNCIYNFGGSLTPSKVTKYHITEDRWEVIEAEIPEGGRFLHSSVFDSKQFIYLLGGFPRSASIVKFNLVTQEFTKMRDMKSLWKIATVYDPTTNSIYTIGGCNISGSSVDTFDRFDVEQNKWVELAPLNHAMFSGGAIIDSNNGYIYAFGGFNSQNNETLNRVERYSIEHNKWEVVEPEMPARMILTNSTFFDGHHYVYLAGGHNPTTKENVSVVYRFNTITFEWDILSTFQHHRHKGSAVYVSK